MGMAGSNSLAALGASEGAPEAQEQPHEGLPLETLVNMVDDAEEASYAARGRAETCGRYFHGEQLTASEKGELKKRRQPPVIDNVVKRKIKFLLGHEKQTRTDPKAFARNETDEKAAETATDILRFQEQRNMLDKKFSSIWSDMLIYGYGGMEVLGADPVDPTLIEIKMWRYDRLGYDPHSSSPDFVDATYTYAVTWMDQDRAMSMYPQAKDAIGKTMSDEISKAGGRTYDDKPAWNAWASRAKRPRVKIIQMYYQMPDGSWCWCIFTRAGKLDGGKVELTDQYGRSVNPMILQSAYVDQDNNRYGEVADMISLQDALNKRHSKALHLLNSRQTMGEQGAVLDIDKAKRELARPDGHVELRPGALSKKQFQIMDNAKEMAGNIEMMRDTRAALMMVGPNAAMEGRQNQLASGRAIRASQEGGLVELTDLKDLHTDLKRRTYEAIWNRCRQFLTDESVIRITDDDKKPRWVKLNRQITMLEDLMRQAEDEGVPPEEVDAKIEQAMADPRTAQQLQQIVRVENAPAEMDMDIIIETSTDNVNMQEETFQSLVELANAGVIFPPEVYIDASAMKQSVKDRAKKSLEKPPEAQQLEAEQADLAKRNAHAEVAVKETTAMKNQAQAQAAMQPQPGPAPQMPEMVDPVETELSRQTAIADIHVKNSTAAKNLAQARQASMPKPGPVIRGPA